MENKTKQLEPSSLYHRRSAETETEGTDTTAADQAIITKFLGSLSLELSRDPIAREAVLKALDRHQANRKAEAEARPRDTCNQA